jgi:hypothetical protein
MGVFQNEKSLLMDSPLGFSNENFTIYHSFEGPLKSAFGFLQKCFFDGFLEKLNFSRGSTWPNFDGCSGHIAPAKNSNTPDLFYPRMDLQIEIIKLGSDFFKFPIITLKLFEAYKKCDLR